MFARFAPTQDDTKDTNSMQHSNLRPNSQMFTKIFTTKMVRSAEKLIATEKVAAAGMGTTRVYHRTWTSNRWMSGEMGKAWVRKLKACNAAKNGLFEQHRHGRRHRAAQRQRKTLY